MIGSLVGLSVWALRCVVVFSGVSVFGYCWFIWLDVVGWVWFGGCSG